MSDSPAHFSFPHRTPVFTALVVIACFASFAWLARKIYTPHAATVVQVEGVRTPNDRKKLLGDQKNSSLSPRLFFSLFNTMVQAFFFISL